MHYDRGRMDDRDDDLTRASAATTVPPAAAVPPASLVPGALVAGRYRLIALLGRGGMGEVYRADDLTLDQPVALKFLPGNVAGDEGRLAQFHNELRVARQVSHKNVCRLYDLGEHAGRRFLTMEYVDGEDLASLLRRVGRIPGERAVPMARQLCAGVAAAHERGVVHRDLKPANVMIDGAGNVRVTDFGIATAAAERSGGELVGTPQYMAPEQLAGQPATIRSDVYALGLILFELFTGKRAIESQTLKELLKFHETGTLTTPSSIVRDLDPAVERVIQRCLERDPQRRPPSALAVAAALPGADPLAAALAAGETPSPEILAAAGETPALGVGRGLGLAVFIVAGLLAFAAASSRTSLVGRTPLDEPTDVLVDRAERVIAALGYPELSGEGDNAYGWTRFDDYIRWLRTQRLGPGRWSVLADGNPSAMLFWYRSSPRDLVPIEEAMVSLTDPPAIDAGMRTVVLDPRGRLQRFRAVPPQFDDDAGTSRPPDWSALFDAAGLSRPSFSERPPQWTPDSYADTRVAWQGPHPVKPELQLRVEAASYRGLPVFFEVIGPWSEPDRIEGDRMSSYDRVFIAVVVGGLLMLTAAAAVLARRHLRSDRADRRGAARLTTCVSGAGFVAWLLRADHPRSVEGQLDVFFRAAGDLALIAILLWVVYIALEPYVRRLWPHALLGWSRLLAGHVRDPRVGHDVLVGLAAGVALALIDLGKATLLPMAGLPAPYPRYGSGEEFLGAGSAAVWAWLLQIVGAIGAALFTVLLIVILRLALRVRWLAMAATVFVLSLLSIYDMSSLLFSAPFPLASGILLTVVALRFGLLSLVVTRWMWGILGAVPFTLDVTRWFAPPSNWTIVVVVAGTLFAFYASRAGQPLLGTILKE